VIGSSVGRRAAITAIAREGADKLADGETACAIATRIVGLLREHAGRGPTKAKCAITPDLVVVTLGDCLTTVEELTQRQVVAYLTAQQHEPDLAVLIFYLGRPQPTASLEASWRA